ncbi:MAG: ABC transporter permease [Betaproteobacteria bacterium]|nr:ABC transporter permease [Betaproteobacteria bacterium]
MSAKGRLEREYLRSQHEGSPVSGTARLARGLLPKLLYAAILIALWQAAIVVLELKEFLVPSPLAVFNALFSPETAAQYQWWTHIATTLGEILAAFVFTAVFGFVLALLITWSDIVRGIAMPVIAVFNSLPKIALAPLFLIWFGYGFTANVTIAILVAFFPVVLNTTTGLDDVDEDLLDLVRYLHASKLQVFLKIRIPMSLPYVVSGLKISATLSVVGAIVGEFVASSQGLGFLIKDSQAMMNTPPMFASLILISCIGLGLFAAIAALEKVFMPWNRSPAEEGSR